MKNIILFILIITLLSCQNYFNRDDNNLIIKKSYYESGAVKSEIVYSDSINKDYATNYYEDGSIHSTIEYKNNKKYGLAKKYYENGKLYRTTPYQNDLINGIQKKYYENGMLMAEIPYENSDPGIGLKEYDGKGKLINNNVEITIREIDSIRTNDTYTLLISLSDNSKKVKFFQDTLINKKYLSRYCLPLPSEEGVSEIKYYVVNGGSVKEKLSIIARKTTRYGNPLIIEKSIYVDIKNFYY